MKMKKVFNTLLLGLTLTLATACAPIVNNAPSKNAVDPAPTEEVATHTTYLVLGRHGLFKGANDETAKKGEKIPSLFLENTITFTANPGDDLPGKAQVTSDVKDVEFVTWLAYEGLGKPTTYDKVPNEDNKILYASFKSTVVEGGGTEGGGGDEGGGQPPVEEKTLTIYATPSAEYGENISVYGWNLKGGHTQNEWPGDKMTFDETTGYYKYDMDTTFTAFKFNDGTVGGKESNEIALDFQLIKAGYCLYSFAHSKWFKPGEEKNEVAKTFDIIVNAGKPGERKIQLANNPNSGAANDPGFISEYFAKGVKLVTGDTITFKHYEKGVLDYVNQNPAITADIAKLENKVLTIGANGSGTYEFYFKFFETQNICWIAFKA